MQIPKPTEGGSFELAPAGTHVAVCYRFIDKGTHKTEFNGESKLRHEVLLTWELGDELMTDGRPFSASKTYTWSMHEKASLRRDLEAWRGRSFVDDDFDGPNAFNTRKLLGAPCMLTITHETKGDRTFAKIVSIGKLTKGITPKALTNPMTYLALAKDGWDPAVFGGLSDKMRESIAETPEYKQIMGASQRHDDPGDGYNAGHDPDDDIPF